MKKIRESVCVIGLGYIGLPTASLLATKGYQVLGVDVNEQVVNTINLGNIHIVEPGLDTLVKSAVNSGNLVANTKPSISDIYILAVPTPFKGNHEPDLAYVEAAAKSIAPLLKKGDLVILESTSPVGTTEFVKTCIEKVNPTLEGVLYAHCPERVIPGRVLQELVENDRVVGGLDDESTEFAAQFYSEFVDGKVLKTDARTAEMCKLTENSFRDVNIAFANELSLICDKLNINVWELIKLANCHPRVNILQPGPGVGGHCIAVDPWFIVASAPDSALLIKQAREVNNYKPAWVIEKVKEAAKNIQAPVVGCLGLSFKADIDDLRESPAKLIVETLMKDKQFSDVLVCEPNVSESSFFKLTSIEDIIEKSDIILVLVDHKEFKALKHEQFKGKIVIDTKGLAS